MDKACIFPLLGAAFEPGHCEETVEQYLLEGHHECHCIAESELNFLRGFEKPTILELQMLTQSSDPSVRLCAQYFHAFSLLFDNKIAESHTVFLDIERGAAQYKVNGSYDVSTHFGKMYAFVAQSAQITTHLDLLGVRSFQPLRALCSLPIPFQMYSGYCAAYAAHVEQRYEYALGIVDSFLALAEQEYPIAEAYLHMLAAIEYICLHKVNDARREFERTVELILPDRLISIPSIYHSMLSGLVEVCMRDTYPDEYRQIVDASSRYYTVRKKLMKMYMVNVPEFGLSAVEWSIATLASRGWKNADIASYMGVSLGTVKRVLSIVFNKLGVTKRSQLRAMLSS